MKTCNTCHGRGVVTVKDDVRKHLTGRGLPPKTRACPRCKGTGQVSATADGCFWLMVAVAVLVFLMVAAAR